MPGAKRMYSFREAFWPYMVIWLHLCLIYDAVQYGRSGELTVFWMAPQSVILLIVLVAAFCAFGEQLRLWRRQWAGKPVIREDQMLPTDPRGFVRHYCGSVLNAWVLMAFADGGLYLIGSRPLFSQLATPPMLAFGAAVVIGYAMIVMLVMQFIRTRWRALKAAWHPGQRGEVRQTSEMR